MTWVGPGMKSKGLPGPWDVSSFLALVSHAVYSTLTCLPLCATAPVPTLMSQYSRPLAVLVGAPVTLVGPLVVGFAAAFLAGAVWAMAKPGRASRVMARMRVFIIPLSLITTFCVLVSVANPKLPSCTRLWRPKAAVLRRVFKPARSHQFPPGRLSEALLLLRWSAPAAPA